jgi:hypothetical protein
MFILLARDPDAAEAVRWWVTLRQARIGRGEKPLEDHALLAEALSCAASMVSWRDEASDPHEYGQVPRWKLPQAGTPMGGLEVDWPTLQVQTYVWEFGNRFRMWEANGDYWFAEWTEDADSGQWSGAYPLQRNLQKEMLIAAYNDQRAAVQHKVEAVKSLLPLPHYSDIATMLREIGCAAVDCKAGEVDQALVDGAEEKLRRFLWENAEDFANGVEIVTEHPPCQSLAPPSVATSVPNSVEVRHVDPPKAESDLIDVTDTPELPPHRFTIFTKSKHWGYGRGLEINPSHIPDMLDRMMADGYVLQAVFGGVEPTKVGMLFRRMAVVEFRQSGGQIAEVLQRGDQP